jgi:MiaB/RimO family radical SAM methylthiotransferase
MPEIDALVGSSGKDSIPEKVIGLLAGDDGIHPCSAAGEPLLFDCPKEHSMGRTRAYLKIGDGCDRYCAYCVIPYARGAVKSRPASELLDEAAALIRRGYKEIILTGINAALYNDDGLDLIGLTKSIAELPGDFRLRLSSLEPTTVNADYARRLVRTGRLCPHLHLSLQSGSDKVLAAMGRNYTMDNYMDIVRVLKERDPLFGLTTDIIVGFPGETESDFERSLEVVREIGFAHVHVFRYSKRPQTRAMTMPNQIPEHIKKQRAARLIYEAERMAAEYRERCRGSVRQALVLGTVADVSTADAPNNQTKTKDKASLALRALTDIGIEVDVFGGGEMVNTFVWTPIG